MGSAGHLKIISSIMSTTFNLESLGITKEELTERVVNAIADDLLYARSEEDEGGERQWFGSSALKAELDKILKQRIDDAVRNTAEKYVFPRVDEIINALVLQETTKWGEKKGDPLSFTEYMVARAEAYLADDVDSYGRSKQECKEANSSWYGSTGKRINRLVDEKFKAALAQVVEPSVKVVNQKLAEHLNAAVQTSLREILGAFKIVATK